MRALLVGIVTLAAAACTGRAADHASDQTAKAPGADTLPHVVLETTKGRIVLELNARRAPKSVENFLILVRGGFYNGLVFHRVKPNFMIQAGYVTADLRRRAVTRPPIYNEADNGLHNVRGALAMARTSYPNSATTQFFINLVDNPTLDYKAPTDEGFGYAVFGHVIEGMNVVDAIGALPTTRRDEFPNWPVQPVTITRAYVDTGTSSP
jgi:cyclophilin family peptidyl-prolyl cis-trans isomerase